jgi:hydrogenase maturation protease
MNTPPTPRLKVIGVGNEWRGDDAVGLLVARRLKADQLPEVSIAECRGTVTVVREAWKDADMVIVVDAVVSGGRPGAIHRFNAHGAGVPVELSRSPSSHGWGVAEALALGQLFQELPPDLIIYGIEGHNFGPGQEVSEEVEAAIPEAVRRIRREIEKWLGRDPPEGHPSSIGEQS